MQKPPMVHNAGSQCVAAVQQQQQQQIAQQQPSLNSGNIAFVHKFDQRVY